MQPVRDFLDRTLCRGRYLDVAIWAFFWGGFFTVAVRTTESQWQNWLAITLAILCSYLTGRNLAKILIRSPKSGP